MDADALQSQQREREWFHSLTVPAGVWTVLRVDGRGFSKLTEASFTKPYDESFRDHMVAAAAALMADFGAAYGYTQSDEISVALPPTFDVFGRSVEKLVSISAGIASASFTMAAQLPAHFDSRIWIGATVEEVVDYFSWRQSDASRSALNNWSYWTLRQSGRSVREATDAITGLSTSGKNELLFSHGINFNDLPGWQRRGIGLRWQDYQRVGVDPRTGIEREATRRRLQVDDDLPAKDAYRALVHTTLASPRP